MKELGEGTDSAIINVILSTRYLTLHDFMKQFTRNPKLFNDMSHNLMYFL